MTKLPADHDARIRAAQLLNEFIVEGGTNELLDAITSDLQEASKQADAADALVAVADRLTKIESQTQVLAEAVIAITHTDPAVESAVQAVIDQMADQPKG